MKMILPTEVKQVKDYPVNLRLDDEQVVIVGGGRVAYRKLRRLLEFSCLIRLISPRLDERIEPLLIDERIDYIAREFRASDLEGAFLVFAATDDDQLNREISELSGADALVNVADANELSTFTLPAVVSEGKLTLAVSTGGASPALSRQIRKKLTDEFGSEYGEYLNFVYYLRRNILQHIDDTEKRRKILKKLGDLELVDLFITDRDEAISKIRQLVQEKAEISPDVIFQGVKIR